MSENCCEIMNCEFDDVLMIDKYMFGRTLLGITYDNQNWTFEAKRMNEGPFFTVTLRTSRPYTFPLGRKIQFCITVPKNGGVDLSLSHTIPSGIKISEFESAILKWSTLRPYIVNNHLKIICKVTEISEQSRKISVYEPMMDNKSLSDVTLLVEDVKLSAHKFVLHAHSPVFEKMFSHEMKESITNEVEIKEMNSEIFKEILRYMYTGNVSSLEEKVQEILIAADRYQINGLILMCLDFLCKNITMENVAEMFKIADHHNSSILKANCCMFILQNFEDFVKLKECMTLAKTYADLFVEIARKIGFDCNVTLKK